MCLVVSRFYGVVQRGEKILGKLVGVLPHFFLLQMDHHVRDRDLENSDERVWMDGRKERRGRGEASKCWRKKARP